MPGLTKQEKEKFKGRVMEGIGGIEHRFTVLLFEIIDNLPEKEERHPPHSFVYVSCDGCRFVAVDAIDLCAHHQDCFRRLHTDRKDFYQKRD